jgi:uncharacterized membrane protein HdeD (DUF308 family)
MLSGVLGVMLGVLMWRQWPLAGQWAIGVAVGASFVISGLSMTMMGLAGRAYMRALSKEQSA